jgi:hypothetical protein
VAVRDSSLSIVLLTVRDTIMLTKHRHTH